MYRRKKIALFISHIYGYYQTKLCDGILKKATESGYQVDVFTTNDGEDLGDYGQGEFEILNVPTPGLYDGVLFASGTYLLPALYEKLSSYIKEAFHCPVIDISQHDSCFPRIELDNNSAFEDLAIHLIKSHGFKKIVYLGIASYPEFNTLRQEAFLRGLTSQDSSSQNCIFTCESLDEKDIHATMSTLLEQKPDAIVCYNDNVALTVISILKEMGISVPEQIAVTGCDQIPLGQNSVPALTTISFPIEQIGATAVEMLSNVLHGMEVAPVTTIAARIFTGNSCGCPSSCTEAPYLAKELEKYQFYMEQAFLFHMQMSANLQGVHDLEQGITLLTDYIQKLPNCKEFYFCLYEDWDAPASHIRKLISGYEESYDSDIVMLKIGLKEGKLLPECTFSRRNLLPEHLYDSGNPWYVYCPLFFGSKLYGYLALTFKKEISSYPFIFMPWIMNVNNMLKDICDKKELGLLVERLESIYKTDELTGLLNRQGFKAYLAPALEKAISDGQSVCSMMVDLDCLKLINDTFGHQEGDFAIRVLAHAIENTVDDTFICSRRGGDEFQLLAFGRNSGDIDAVIEQIRKYLHNYNRLNTKPYNIEASFGYSLHPLNHAEELPAMFEEADKKMYEEKKTKTKNILKG